jgi:hypothetical protein
MTDAVHRCGLYCAGDVHAIPVLAPSDWRRPQVQHAWEVAHPTHALVTLFPAREGDLQAWLSQDGWDDATSQGQRPTARCRPWLALAHIRPLPLAPGPASRTRGEDSR